MPVDRSYSAGTSLKRVGLEWELSTNFPESLILLDRLISRAGRTDNVTRYLTVFRFYNSINRQILEE